MASKKYTLLIYIVLVGIFSSNLQAQSNLGAAFTGTVTSERGELIAAASITLQATDTRAVINLMTNEKGVFKTSEIKPGTKYNFTITHIGYETSVLNNILAGGENRTPLVIILKESSNSLTDVVVTALNIKRNPRSLGYSIAKVDGSKINSVQTPNLINALAGKVPGVDVSNISNGVAGSKRIVIRGAASLTGNTQPLWVVDGTVINTSVLGNGTAFGGTDYGDGLTGINPDDIESISILKGNAAAALYGSRASNGVILVTTKSGKSARNKSSVDFSTSLLIDKLYDLNDFQKLYGQSALTAANQRPTNQADARGADSWGPKFDGVPTIQYDGVLRPYSALKNNFESFFKTGSTITNTVAVSGSNQGSNYRLSVSDLRNSDIVPNTNFTRTSVNGKLQSTFGKLETEVIFNYTYEKAKNRPFTGGNVSNLFYSLLYMPANLHQEALAPGYNPDGSEFTYADFINNPYFIINREQEKDTKTGLQVL